MSATTSSSIQAEKPTASAIFPDLHPPTSPRRLQYRGGGEGVTSLRTIMRQRMSSRGCFVVVDENEKTNSWNCKTRRSTIRGILDGMEWF
jgi:hypothetical protein